MKFISLLYLVGIFGFCQVKAFSFSDIVDKVTQITTETFKYVKEVAAKIIKVKKIVTEKIDTVKENLITATQTARDWVRVALEVVIILTPGIFSLGTDLFGALDRLCSFENTVTKLTSSNININYIKFQLRTGCKKHSFPVLKAEEMGKSRDFDKNKTIVILASGWQTNIDKSDPIDAFAKAYSCRGDVNFVALDAADYIDTIVYTRCAGNTEDIGKHVAEGLVRLAKIVPKKNIHLIGHSLGAHIMGSAGRNFNSLTGKLIPRITGLDPANPCFGPAWGLIGLQRGDAEFIDVIHSNPGQLGKRDPVGDVDFYPGGLAFIPAGCFLSPLCAHSRAWEYYAETIYPGNERNFLGARCSSLTKLRENKCPGGFYPMGFDVPQDIKGSYFLEINAGNPYGRNSNPKRDAAYQSCGVCPRNKG